MSYCASERKWSSRNLRRMKFEYWCVSWRREFCVMAASRKKKPRGRPRKNAAAEYADFDAMDEAINANRAEVMIARAADGIGRILDGVPDWKMQAILRALHVTEQRLLLQTLLQTVPKELV